MTSLAEADIQRWTEMYVSDRWSLAELEAHLEAMLPLLRPEDWLPYPREGQAWLDGMSRSQERAVSQSHT